MFFLIDYKIKKIMQPAKKRSNNKQNPNSVKSLIFDS